MSLKVSIQDTEKQFSVDQDESVLEAALYQDVALPYGCQSGGCGACRAKIIAGDIQYDYDPPGLSAVEKSQGYALLCQAHALTDLVIQIEELPDHHAIQVRNIPVRVERREKLSHDVMGLWLKLPKGEIFEYLPGQYLDILLRDGRRRSFSIANSPGNFRETARLELHLRHVPGGHFTDQVFGDMPERAMLRVEGPLGGFYIREERTSPIVMIAGGTGFAPIKAMLEQLLVKPLSRDVHLYWGVRAERDLYAHAYLTEQAAASDRFHYVPVLSDPEAGDHSEWLRGYVHEAVASDFEDMSELDVYMSGPPVMIEAGKQQFYAKGLDPENLHFDAFDYAHETWPEQEKGSG